MCFGGGVEGVVGVEAGGRDSERGVFSMVRQRCSNVAAGVYTGAWYCANARAAWWHLCCCKLLLTLVRRTIVIGTNHVH